MTITNPFIREGGRTVGSGRVATIIEYLSRNTVKSRLPRISSGAFFSYKMDENWVSGNKMVIFIQDILLHIQK